MTKNILVPIDFSNVTDAVLDWARQLARAVDAKLWVIHVAPTMPNFVGYEVDPVAMRQAVAYELRDAHRKLQDFQRSVEDSGIEATSMLLPGRPVDKILEEADRLGADLIVLGSHGHGALYNLLAGSVCTGVLERASCPVLIVPSKMAEAPRAPEAEPAAQEVE